MICGSTSVAFASEVQNLHAPIGRDKQVVGLDITMNDAPGPVRRRGRRRSGPRGRPRAESRALPCPAGRAGSGPRAVRDELRDPVVLADVVDGENVRVVERRRGVGLLTGLRVLIVDDNPVNCEILRAMTGAWMMEPRDSTSPLGALAWLRRGDAFDLVIIGAARVSAACATSCRRSRTRITTWPRTSRPVVTPADVPPRHYRLRLGLA